ncbi:DegV family protein [Candidatus Villigracilis affinis]|uniref:DegV family protein n=1 Tax=Candidatus Villigracilis affinis TaxID=3140682 RepID=UPI002A1B7D77|nr:DegV family protein [Anaerolineales bacterium]
MKIVTDCAADMPNEELERLGIVQAPLFIQFPEGEVNAMEISADEFYNRLEAMRPQIPTTAQPSSGIFAELYRKLALTEKNIFSIHISSGLSGTINSARDGGEQVKAEANVSFWDTLTLSGGERFQVVAAALAHKAGWTLDKIQERLTKIREKTEVIYTLDTLEYLARGGRIGRVKALAGALLNLKPIIRVDTDGKYSTVKNERTINKSIAAIADHLAEKYGNTPVWVTVLHGRFAEKADVLANEFKQKLNIAKMEVQRISPVLGVHTGPGIVGAAVVPMELMSDLGE